MESGKAQNTSPTLALSLAVGPQTSYLTSLGFCLLTCKINTDLPCGLYPLSLSLRGPIPLPPPPAGPTICRVCWSWASKPCSCWATCPAIRKAPPALGRAPLQ